MHSLFLSFCSNPHEASIHSWVHLGNHGKTRLKSWFDQILSPHQVTGLSSFWMLNSSISWISKATLQYQTEDSQKIVKYNYNNSVY